MKNLKRFSGVVGLMAGLLTSGVAFAHGEDQPGPHGGHIRMPGAYHTELVSLGKNQIRIYLLDLHFKNPSVKNSSVEVSFQENAKNVNAEALCKVEKTSFLCTFKKNVNLNKTGSMMIQSVREGQKGAVAKYATPLKS